MKTINIILVIEIYSISLFIYYITLHFNLGNFPLQVKGYIFLATNILLVIKQLERGNMLSMSSEGSNLKVSFFLFIATFSLNL